MPRKVISTQEEVDILRKVLDITDLEEDLERVLREVVCVMGKIADVDSVFIYLFNKTRSSLVLRAASSGHREDIGRVMLKAGEGLTGYAASTGERVVIEKGAYNDPRFKAIDVLPEDRYEAFLAQPIVFKSKVIGVANFQQRKAHVFPANVLDLLAAAAGKVGGVIEHARLYDEINVKARQFDALVRMSETIVSERYLDEILNLIIVATAQLFNTKICSIMLVDPTGSDLVIRAAQCLSNEYRRKPHLKIRASLMGEVVKTRIPLVVEDVRTDKRYFYRDMAVREGLTSMLAVPMIARGKAIGVVSIYTKEPHRFLLDEINVIQIVANQAAVAVVKAQLMEESVKAAEALETRKLVDKAKAILMRLKDINEDVAYRIIHRKSMDTSRSMKEIAESIILMDSFHEPRLSLAD